MDRLADEVRQQSPWTVMFADNIVICSESRVQVGRWSFAPERRGMKVSPSKTEYMCVNQKDQSGTLRLEGGEIMGRGHQSTVTNSVKQRWRSMEQEVARSRLSAWNHQGRDLEGDPWPDIWMEVEKTCSWVVWEMQRTKYFLHTLTDMSSRSLHAWGVPGLTPF